MAHYTFENISPMNQTLTQNFFPVWATLTETMVFGYLGMGLFAYDGDYDIGFIIYGLIAILIARAFNVFPLSWLVNIFRKPNFRITLKYQFFIWFAGLRGAIAFALARETPGEIGAAMFSTTLMIVYFTVFVEGGATIPLLRKLKIPINVDYDNEPESVEPTKYELWFQRMDVKYFHPFFTKKRIVLQSVTELELGSYSPTKVDQGTSPSQSPSASPPTSPTSKSSRPPLDDVMLENITPVSGVASSTETKPKSSNF